MVVRIMVYFLFICSISSQNLVNQHRNLNYSIQGLNHKIIRINENKDKIANSNQRNNTQFFIERHGASAVQPWWLNLKQNRNETVQTATGIPTVKEIELVGRKDARRGRSYYASESVSHATSNIIIIWPILQHLILATCFLPSLFSCLSNGKLLFI